MLRLLGCLILLVGLLGRPGAAQAQPAHINNWLNDAQSGALLLRASEREDWQPALLLETRFDVQVSGPVARVRLEQRFRNTLDRFAEGVYAFPLAERAGVHGMQMMIGERRIVGRIEEKAQARRIYEQARAQGQATALVEQRRPNIFNTSVANIEPGKDIVVHVEYTELLVPEGTRLSLRLPLTMTRGTAAGAGAQGRAGHGHSGRNGQPGGTDPAGWHAACPVAPHPRESGSGRRAAGGQPVQPQP